MANKIAKQLVEETIEIANKVSKRDKLEQLDIPLGFFMIDTEGKVHKVSQRNGYEVMAANEVNKNHFLDQLIASASKMEDREVVIDTFVWMVTAKHKRVHSSEITEEDIEMMTSDINTLKQFKDTIADTMEEVFMSVIQNKTGLEITTYDVVYDSTKDAPYIESKGKVVDLSDPETGYVGNFSNLKFNYFD